MAKNNQKRSYFITHSQYHARCAGDKVEITTTGVERAARYTFNTDKPTSEQCKSVSECCDKHNVKSLFQDLLRRFEERYHFQKPEINFINTYTKTMQVFVENEDMPFIFLDHLVFVSHYQEIAYFLLWSKYNGDVDEDKAKNIGRICFESLLFTMIELCHKGKLLNNESYDLFLERFKNEEHILTISSDIHWVSIAFALAHELAHIFLNHPPTAGIDNLHEQEFEADKVAYEIILDFILEQKAKENKVEFPAFCEYTYLAPLMLLDFYDLIDYTYSVLYDSKDDEVNFWNHPSVEDRKEQLFDIVDLPKYQFDTEEGNVAYNSYLDVYELYKEKIKADHIKKNLKDRNLI